MKYSIVLKKNTVGDFRLDSEVYLPIYFEIEEKLKQKNCTTLENERSLFSKGIFDIRAECYMENGGVPFIRINNLGDTLLNDNEIIHIPHSQNNLNKKTHLVRNDLILSKTAYPAACLVDISSCNTSQDTIAIKLKKHAKIKPHFVAIFLNSRYGYFQMQRWFTGNIQMHLNLTDSKQIKIPILDESFQSLLVNVLETAIKYKYSARNSYLRAEQILLSELGLFNWKPDHQLSFVKNFSDTKSADRIDAEHFKPMYEQIHKRIKNYKLGYKPLCDILKIKDKNFIPKPDLTYKYIELANISTNGNVNGFTHATGKELPSRARRKVNAGDVIVSSIEGSLSSIALITADLDGALCSTGFFVVKSDQINSETLLILLKSQFGQLQLKKGCSGSILTAISKDEFKRILLPEISSAVQEEIRSKISEMYAAKLSLKRLIDISKRAVEMAIEKNEEAAMEWINKHLEG